MTTSSNTDYLRSHPLVYTAAVALAKVGYAAGNHNGESLWAYVAAALDRQFPRVAIAVKHEAAGYGVETELGYHTHFEAGDITVDPATGVGAIASGVNTVVVNPVKKLVELVGALFRASTWIRVLLVLLGVVALIGAMFIFARELGAKGAIPDGA